MGLIIFFQEINFNFYMTTFRFDHPVIILSLLNINLSLDRNFMFLQTQLKKWNLSKNLFLLLNIIIMSGLLNLHTNRFVYLSICLFLFSLFFFLICNIQYQVLRVL